MKLLATRTTKQKIRKTPKKAKWFFVKTVRMTSDVITIMLEAPSKCWRNIPKFFDDSQTIRIISSMISANVHDDS